FGGGFFSRLLRAFLGCHEYPFSLTNSQEFRAASLAGDSQELEGKNVLSHALCDPTSDSVQGHRFTSLNNLLTRSFSTVLEWFSWEPRVVLLGALSGALGRCVDRGSGSD